MTPKRVEQRRHHQTYYDSDEKRSEYELIDKTEVLVNCQIGRSIPEQSEYQSSDQMSEDITAFVVEIAN